MNKNSFFVPIALVLMTAFVVPSVLFFIPVRAHAQLGVPTVEVNPLIVAPTGTTAVKTTLSAILEGLTQVNTFLTQIATYAQWVNTFVLQPLAFILSGNLMKALTAGVLNFVIGKANGTGIPQFAVNVQKSLQTLADAKNRAFISQVGLSGSPFSSSIAGALNTNYLTRSSLAGFWRANLNTLRASAPGIPATANIPAYLSGNWLAGGIGAWFALTTQPQNNPYMFYQTAQSQLESVIGSGSGGATGSRLAELSWGSGFMSWCSASDDATKSANVANTALQACEANCSSSSNPVSCFTKCERDNPSAAGTNGVNVGDACTKSDGTAGTVQTPGSTIKATLDKVLGGQQDKLVMMGNIGSQINGILSAVGTIMNTVNLAQNILGGGSSGGLLNSGPQIAAYSPTRDESGNFTSGYFGATNAQINADAAAATAAAQAAAAASAATASSTGALESAKQTIGALDMTARATLYKTSWGTIGAAAGTAQTDVTSLQTFCSAAATTAALALIDPTPGGFADSGYAYPYGTDPATVHSVFVDAARAQAVSAQDMIASFIAPILTQAANAPQVADAAIAMDAKVQSELASGSASYAADLQTLKSMSPTVNETAQAQQDSQVIGIATANPTGSLSIVPNSSTNYASVVSNLNLLSANSKTLQTTVCNPNSSLYGGGGGGGG
jgi:hypothetical protein